LEEKKFSIYLDLVLELSEEEGDDGQTVSMVETEQLIMLPYHPAGKMIQVYDANKKPVARKDVAYLADVCGDEVCQQHKIVQLLLKMGIVTKKKLIKILIA